MFLKEPGGQSAVKREWENMLTFFRLIYLFKVQAKNFTLAFYWAWLISTRGWYKRTFNRFLKESFNSTLWTSSLNFNLLIVNRDSVLIWLITDWKEFNLPCLFKHNITRSQEILRIKKMRVFGDTGCPISNVVSSACTKEITGSAKSTVFAMKRAGLDWKTELLTAYRRAITINQN